MRDNPTLTLYPSKIKMSILLLISIFLTITGVGMINKGDFKGWLVAILFGIGIIVFIMNLLPDASHLRLSDEGLEIRSLYRNNFINWYEVERFEAKYIRNKKTVVFDFTPYSKYKTARKIMKTITGAEGGLPDTYGKSADELVMLLNEWKEKGVKM